MNMKFKRGKGGKELRTICQETGRGRCVRDKEKRKWRERVIKGGTGAETARSKERRCRDDKKEVGGGVAEVECHPQYE